MSAIEIMTPAMLDQMREACQLAGRTLCFIADYIQPGITTEELDHLVHEYTLKHGARSAPLGYKGFPKSICTSINEVVCHGIPEKRALRAGDIINIDVTPYFPSEHGYHGDTSATFYVGEPSDDAKRVVEVSRQCLELGIAEVRDGARLGDIGAAIQEFAESHGCSVVQDFVGHGVGRGFHMPPQVPHYGKRGQGKRLRTGMVFTIEPMINIGRYETKVLDDAWTAVTMDGSLSAQFEHTVAVTRTGCEVLTTRPCVLKHSEDVPWARLGPLSSPAAFGAQSKNNNSRAAEQARP